MSYDLEREVKENCGCIEKYFEHDFWPTNNYTIVLHCPQHEEEYQEEIRKRKEIDRQKYEERNRLIEELERIANGVNSQVPL